MTDSENNQVTCIVQQNAASDVYVLSITPSSLGTFSASGGDQDVLVTATKNGVSVDGVIVTHSGDWISTDKDTVDDNDYLYIDASSNTGAERTGSVTLAITGGPSLVIPVSQAAMAAQTTFSIPASTHLMQIVAGGSYDSNTYSISFGSRAVMSGSGSAISEGGSTYLTNGSAQSSSVNPVGTFGSINIDVELSLPNGYEFGAAVNPGSMAIDVAGNSHTADGTILSGGAVGSKAVTIRYPFSGLTESDANATLQITTVSAYVSSLASTETIFNGSIASGVQMGNSTLSGNADAILQMDFSIDMGNMQSVGFGTPLNLDGTQLLAAEDASQSGTGVDAQDTTKVLAIIVDFTIDSLNHGWGLGGITDGGEIETSLGMTPSNVNVDNSNRRITYYFDVSATQRAAWKGQTVDVEIQSCTANLDIDY
jgi:hypothetical protein